MKKIISLLLVLVMVLGMSVSSFAATEKEEKKNVKEVTFEDLLTDKRYKDLDINIDEIEVFRQLESNDQMRAASATDVIEDIQAMYDDAG